MLKGLELWCRVSAVSDRSDDSSHGWPRFLPKRLAKVADFIGAQETNTLEKKLGDFMM